VRHSEATRESRGNNGAHLAETLDTLLTRTIELKNNGDAIDLALFGPLLGRATVEVSLTAITARFDPFRILAIRKSQMASAYDPKSRNPLAFNWSSDVQGEEKPKDWEQRPALKDVQRALLCKHFNDIFWQEAFTFLLDAVPVNRGHQWMGPLKKLDPEGFTTNMRTKADRTYSELSKGIHYEFVVPAIYQFDRATVSNLLESCWELVGALGLTACFSPAVQPLAGLDPIESYEQAQREFYGHE
jgi:hypothetical protein